MIYRCSNCNQMIYGGDELLCDKCRTLQLSQTSRVKYFLSRECLNLKLPDNEFWELFNGKIYNHPSKIFSHYVLQKYLPKLKITSYQFINMLMIDGLTHNEAKYLSHTNIHGWNMDEILSGKIEGNNVKHNNISKKVENWLKIKDNKKIFEYMLEIFNDIKYPDFHDYGLIDSLLALKPYESNRFMLLGKTTKKNYMLLYDFCKKEDAILTKDLNSTPNYVILAEDGFSDYYRFAMQKMQDKNVAFISLKEFIFNHIMKD